MFKKLNIKFTEKIMNIVGVVMSRELDSKLLLITDNLNFIAEKATVTSKTKEMLEKDRDHAYGLLEKEREEVKKINAIISELESRINSLSKNTKPVLEKEVSQLKNKKSELSNELSDLEKQISFKRELLKELETSCQLKSEERNTLLTLLKEQREVPEKIEFMLNQISRKVNYARNF